MTQSSSSWDDLKFFKSEAWNKLSAKLYETEGVLPHRAVVYRSLELTPFDQVKVVILGQDPYHTKGMADGLAFSVQPGTKPLPPSLRNILKELKDDLGDNVLGTKPGVGSLRAWAERGVLLINTVWTVEENKPNSHRGLGWEKLTYEIIRKLSEEKEHVVFMLWGKQAQEYIGAIDEKRHLVLTGSHPSPYSAMSGYFGGKYFSRANAYLKDHSVEAVDWSL